MKNLIRIGDVRHFTKIVKEEDFARFDDQLVHPVCSTFALAQAVEWASRLFALEEKEADEEGIGTYLKIEHKHPAFLGEHIIIESRLELINKHELICSCLAKVGTRLIARGETGQKILKKEKLAKLLDPKAAIHGKRER
jgi:predicted thioesterase